MHPTLFIAVLCTLVAASPVTKRSAAVVPIGGPRALTTRSTKAVDFDALHAHVGRIREKGKHRASLTPATSPEDDLTKRMMKTDEEPFDVAKRSAGVRRGTASVNEPLTDEFDSVYFGTIEIGTPAQSTTVQIDTGSSDLVVPTADCKGDCAPPLLTFTSSSTFVSSTTPFQIQYGDGSGATGTLAQDTVSVAGLPVAQQIFAAVNYETQGFSGPQAGIMGFGFPADANSRATPWIWNLVASGSLASNVFSIFLARNNATGSELCVGCIDSTKFTGNITYFPIDTTATQGVKAVWTVASGGFSFNGQAASPNYTAIIDSGTTLIIVEPTISNALFAAVPGFQALQNQDETYYTAPCTSFNTSSGEIGVILGNSILPLNIEDMLYGTLTNDPSTCVSAIVGADVGLPGAAILGDAFMKNYYSVFDMQNSQVGFAPST